MPREKYYEQLLEKTFNYKRVLPITYITHLETKHVVMDTLVIKRLRAEVLKAWDGEKTYLDLHNSPHQRAGSIDSTISAHHHHG